MAILYMDSKTFLKKYIKENKPKVVLDTQYAIVSSTIRKSGRHENVISASQLFPGNRMLSDYITTGDAVEFKYSYFNQLEDNKPLLAVLIKGAIEEEYNIVFMCSNKEKKRWKYLKLLSEFVEQEFNYPMIKYEDKDSLSGVKFNKDKTMDKVHKVLKAAKKDKKRKQLQSVRGREKILSKMSKDEMKKELKKMNLYYKGMTKEEMLDTMDLFFVNE